MKDWKDYNDVLIHILFNFDTLKNITHILHLYAKKLRRIEIHDKYYTKNIIF